MTIPSTGRKRGRWQRRGSCWTMRFGGRDAPSDNVGPRGRTDARYPRRGLALTGDRLWRKMPLASNHRHAPVRRFSVRLLAAWAVRQRLLIPLAYRHRSERPERNPSTIAHTKASSAKYRNDLPVRCRLRIKRFKSLWLQLRLHGWHRADCAAQRSRQPNVYRRRPAATVRPARRWQCAAWTRQAARRSQCRAPIQ